MSLLSPLGALVESVGSALHLPELGISEALGSHNGVPINNSYSQHYGPTQDIGTVFAQTAPDTSAQSGGGAYASSVSGAPSFNPDLYNAQFDTQKAQLQGQLDTLPAAQQQQELRTMNMYQGGVNNLDKQHSTGLADLQYATDQINRSKAQSLQQLKDQVDSMYQSYLRNPGVSDSSAAAMISRALGANASRNRASVLQNTGQQQHQVDTQTRDLENSYQQQHQSLDDWKRQTLNDIATSFLQQRQQIEQQMAGADAQKAQGLAQQNAALTNQAIQALQNLQSLYGTQKQQLVDRFNSYNAPTVDLGNLGQYQVQPISAGALSGISNPQPTNQSETPDLVAPIFKKAQDQFGLA